MELPKATQVMSFRLRKETISGVRMAARNAGVSENAFVESVLERRVDAEPLIRAFPIVAISEGTMAAILEAADADRLELSGFDIGKRNFLLTRKLFESAGMNLVFSSYLTDVIGRQGNWVRVENSSVRSNQFTLLHHLGIKWSVFLTSYLAGAYQVTSKDKLQIEIGESFLTMRRDFKTG
jgi:hypothetical protein